jgi:hypothetical protein
MKQLFNWLKNFFFPPPGATRWRRIFPYLLMGILTVIVLISTTLVWDYTNSNQFCGEVCHTMPPQFSTYLASAHAGVDCVECHLGRASLPTKIIRKAQDGTLTFTALISETYEFPLKAHNMRPASEACETCHYPAKFSLDSFREIVHYDTDRNNTSSTTYLILKTGGGTAREGLGYGIHWHIENPVQFISLDEYQQEIPYVRVVHEDGTYTEYIDLESGFTEEMVKEDELVTMDCITCHNRTSHLVEQPYQAVEQLLERGLISSEIPDVRVNAVQALSGGYKSKASGLQGIADLEDFYAGTYPDFYAENSDLIKTMVVNLQQTYEQSVFPEQGLNWDSHPNNIGHEDFPGCFRCHGGQHFNEVGESIRLECNICHSIPVVAGTEDFVANIQIDRGPEPDNHRNPNWITIHREVFDATCESCHTVGDPGGVSNTSFCSNSACHGATWTYAGFDAPAIREALAEQIEALAPVAPEVQPGTEATFANLVTVLTAKCGSCHGTDGMKGLNLTTYEGIMNGGASGPAVIAGDVENSLIYKMLTSSTPHFAQLTTDELNLLIDWIQNGAQEN